MGLGAEFLGFQVSGFGFQGLGFAINRAAHLPETIQLRFARDIQEKKTPVDTEWVNVSMHMKFKIF